jgi:hypothetical protein
MADAESIPPARPQVSPAATFFAAEAGIDLNATLPKAVEDKTTAEDIKQSLQEALPETSSIYEPSGTMPFAAILTQLVGVLLSAPLGLIVGGVVAMVGGLLLLGDIRKLHGKAKILPLLGIVLLCLVMPVVGLMAALCSAWFSRLGKNRSPGGAVIFAFGAATIAMGVAWSLFQVYGKEPLNKLFHVQPGTLDTVYLAVVLLGAPVGMILGGLYAHHAVSKEKFCENCEVYLQQEPLPSLQLGGTLALAKALADKNIPVAIDLFAAPPGELGQAVLFSCPSCGKGYLELNTHFQATWTEGDHAKESTATWLVASTELSDSEVNRFKPLARRAAEPLKESQSSQPSTLTEAGPLADMP